MKILLLGGTPASRGGVEQFCERAERALAQSGRHHVARIDTDTAYLTLSSTWKFARAIMRLIRSRRTAWDCVWLQYVNFPDLVLLVVSRSLGYKVLVTPHLGSVWTSQANRLLAWLGYRMLSFANGIALISQTQADELTLPTSVRTHNIKTFLPQSFPPAIQTTHGPNNPLRLIHAGRLSDGKGSFHFLEVCARLRERQLPFSAILIGPAEQATLQRIEDVLAAKHLHDHVSYLGPLPEDDLMAMLAQSDVLVHLSEIDSFPLIVLEAIGCGAYPICKDLPGARLISRTYCGDVVQHDDAVTLVAQKLEHTLPDVFRATAAVARHALEADYKWEHCVELLEHIVDQHFADAGKRL